MKYIAALLVLMAAPAAAQDLVFSDKPLRACLANGAGDPFEQRNCVGRAADACMEATPGGFSTVVMSGCFDRELSVWDSILNSEYRRLRGVAREIDAQADTTIVPPNDIADSLQAMQRAWITFRDASCYFEAAQWGGGTGAGPAYVACLMTLTAEQALKLQNTQLVY